jgi:hypothetical protein
MTQVRWAVVVLVAFLLFVGVAQGGATGDHRPGDSDVYDRIASLTDCGALRAELADAQEAGVQAAPNSDEAKAAVSYEQAAWDRMVDQSCVG